jgi:outer membrane protein OmpA-like peptidoglycan-associated protein
VTRSTSSTAKTSPKPPRRNPWLLILIFRLLLLSVGGGLAFILGIALANSNPNPNPEKPLVVKVWERFVNKIDAVSPSTNPTPQPETNNSQTELTPVQRQQIAAQLNQMQAQVKALTDSVATVETQLGSSRADEPLEERLQALELQLEGVAAPSRRASSVGSSSTEQAVALSAFFFQPEKIKVTLPSDALFEQDNIMLRPEAGLILDKIIADLRDYPSSTILIAAHTDTTDTDENRELSFRRAKAVEQYLARALGDRYRWLVIGYGPTRPVAANDTNANQQRNRRIEIAVD